MKKKKESKEVSPIFSLGTQANDMLCLSQKQNKTTHSSATLQECIPRRERLAFSSGNLKCTARASCSGKILYTISTKLVSASRKCLQEWLFLRHSFEDFVCSFFCLFVFCECFCFTRTTPIREMELWKPDQRGNQHSLWTTIAAGISCWQLTMEACTVRGDKSYIPQSHIPAARWL